MGLIGRRGISRITILIIILVIASTLTVSFGYFSGFLFGPPQTSEYLELSNATIWDFGGAKAIKFLVKNTGNEDARIEYIVFNGDITPYASKILGEWIPYNFIESEYLIIPYTSQVEMYIPYETNEESLEIRLHTLTGNDFTKILLASLLQTEYEGQQPTNFEQTEIQSAVCIYDATNTQWIVTLRLKNTGTATATLNSVFVNDTEVDKYAYSNPTPNGDAETDMTVSKILDSGANTTIMVYIDQYWRSVTPGTTVNIKLHSVGGMDYIKLITLVSWSSPEQIPPNEGVTIVDLFYSSKPQFTDEAIAFLNSQEIEVNIFRDSNITVDFYRQLPKYGSSLVVLRVHAGVLESDPAKPTFLFTEEPYNTYDYLLEQLSDQVQSGKIDPDNPAEEPVFTIGPLFVTASMESSFNDSIIILSSGLGLYTDQLAEAFIQKGAKVFISWDEKVSLTHTDDACMLLLASLILDEMTIGEAVGKVMTDVGPDTVYDSILKYYPTEAGNLKLDMT